MSQDEERLRHRIEPPIVRREALSSMYESLNYEIAENELYKAEEKKPMHHVSVFPLLFQMHYSYEFVVEISLFSSDL